MSDVKQLLDRVEAGDPHADGHNDRRAYWDYALLEYVSTNIGTFHCPTEPTGTSPSGGSSVNRPQPAH